MNSQTAFCKTPVVVELDSDVLKPYYRQSGEYGLQTYNYDTLANGALNSLISTLFAVYSSHKSVVAQLELRLFSATGQVETFSFSKTSEHDLFIPNISSLKEFLEKCFEEGVSYLDFMVSDRAQVLTTARFNVCPGINKG
jgi:deoxyribodipyrimidine photolyase-like uncharacterized protein